jgi:sulfur carrier protein
MLPSTSSTENTIAVASTVFVNDQARPLAPASMLLGLVREIDLAERKGIAVAVNGTVVRRSDWPARPLTHGDRVVIIQATQGG